MSEWSELVSGAIGGGLVLAIQKGKQLWDDRRDKAKIFDWLQAESKKPGAFDHRSTRAIAKAVSLPPDRVAYLCHYHPKVFASLGPKEDLWNLGGEDQQPAKNFFDLDLPDR
ncbi:hypothetical protein [Pseudomonas sp. GL-RE-26]|uniref:hypothetical protein n=1 Tax=Pseudomonas sp. GL-RE-26 TaxID=2832390 RepID=UPI001CC13AFA|nr:hypothetical protein [Pseudomonas sp. GL-RE-26]